MRMHESESPRRVPASQAPRAKSPRAARVPPLVPDDERIRLRAYELYLQRDGHGGDPMEDWLRAEREVREQLPARAMPARDRRAAPRKRS
jgi:hypothetical protein